MKRDLRIVFMGTPEFAVESLRALVENNYNVVGVITVPDKPAGRGQKLHQSAVKLYALEQGLPILQPEKLKDETFLAELRALNANLQIVVAFRMLPVVVWQMPELGTFNLHGSLLPQYRGAAPINWAVINGDKQTGVTTFFLKHEIDTGEVIFSEKIDIGENDNAGIVHDKLMAIGANLVVKTVQAIELDDVKTVPQEQLIETELKHAPKIFKPDCKINWQQPAQQVHNHIRGLSPYPAAWTEWKLLSGEIVSVKIIETRIIAEHIPAGKMISDGKKQIKIGTADGAVEVLQLQLSGKKMMKTDELLRGFKIEGVEVV